MIGDIRKLLEASPFVPFSVRSTDGHDYPVKSIDNIFVSRDNDRIVITYGMGSMTVLPVEQISGIQSSGA